MTSELIYSQRAERDLAAIGRDSDQRWGRQQTRRYLRDIRDAARNLLDLPNKGRDWSQLIDGMRSSPSGSHMIFFVPHETHIEVVRILHQRMDGGLAFDLL